MPAAWKTISLTTVMLIATGAPSFPKERVGDGRDSRGLISHPCCARMGHRPSPADRDEASALLAIAGEGFRIHQTDHFNIAYDTSYEALRPLTGRLEGTYDAILRFVAGYGLVSEVPADRLEVILFSQRDDFTRYLAGIGLRGGSVAGIYHQQSNVVAFCDTAANPDLQQITGRIKQVRKQLQQLKADRSRAGVRIPSRTMRKRQRELQGRLSTLRLQHDGLIKRFNRFVIQHEAAHQMFFNLGVHVRGADNPNWLVEGLACQFEIPQPQAGEPPVASPPASGAGHAARGILRVNHARLGDFREALHAAPDAKSVSDEAYREALTGGSFVSLADLISEPKLFGESGGNIAFRYAQAWALVYYLHRARRDAFATYLRRLGTRTPGETAERLREIDEFQAAFGEPDEAFQRAWVRYMLRLRFDRREAGR